jgi:Transposase IS4
VDNCRKSYKPADCVTIDEQLLGYRGCCKFTQYISSKPCKYGIKIFWICDATNSYAIDGVIYCGRQPGDQMKKNLGSFIVKTLAKSIQNSGRNITMDNFFTSVELAEDMLKLNSTIVGTLRHNKRPIPLELKPNKHNKKFSSVHVFRKDMTMVSYVPKERKAVILLSTMHNDGETETTGKQKPEIIKFYNSTKGGVDTMDQMVSNYTCKRSTRRWPSAIWSNIMDIAALNAFRIFSIQHPEQYKSDNHQRKRFLKELAKELIMPYMMARASSCKLKAHTQDCMKRCGLQVAHPTMSGPTKRRRCHICPRENDRKSKIACSICNQNTCAIHMIQICDQCQN